VNRAAMVAGDNILSRAAASQAWWRRPQPHERRSPSSSAQLSDNAPRHRVSGHWTERLLSVADGILASVKPNDPKDDLRRYLDAALNAVEWKLEGLSEYDVRRPLTPTGTNLLGLAKHLAGVLLGYFGDTFERPYDLALPWFAEGVEPEPNVDFWATAEESREEILELYRQARSHAAATIDELPLDAHGRVPWWGENGDVTLQRILVHMIAEAQRHAGHADIIRELIDGRAGRQAGSSNLPPEMGDDDWAAHRQRVEDAAVQAQALAEGGDS